MKQAILVRDWSPGASIKLSAPPCLLGSYINPWPWAAIQPDPCARQLLQLLQLCHISGCIGSITLAVEVSQDSVELTEVRVIRR